MRFHLYTKNWLHNFQNWWFWIWFFKSKWDFSTDLNFILEIIKVCVFFQNIHFWISSSCSCCSCGWSSKKCWSASITSWKMMSGCHQRIELRLVSVIAVINCRVIMIGTHCRSSWSSSVRTKSEEICHFSTRHLGFESTCEPSVFGFRCQFAISRLNVFFFQCDGTSNRVQLIVESTSIANRFAAVISSP